MGKLANLKERYTDEGIIRCIVNAVKYDQDPKMSIAYSLNALAKIQYNIMMMMDGEGEGVQHGK